MSRSNGWSEVGMSLATATDSYKATHAPQYPDGTTKVVSYLEARGSEVADYTVFFGLQYYLKRYLTGVVLTREDVDNAEIFWNAHFGANYFRRDLFDYIVEVHGGKLPLKIKAVAEGTKVPLHNVLMTIENTDPKCYWLTNFVETLLLKVWNPITIATNSHAIRQILKEYLSETGCSDVDGTVSWMLHDFGFRGVSSEETAGISAMAHLLSFMGTDTVAGVFFGRKYYNTTDMLGFSVAAGEHSCVTPYGRNGEIEYFRKMLTIYPTGIVSVISDSFHILEAIDKFAELKELIMNREGRLVIRPDSGDPAMTDLKVIEKLGEIFGYEVNDKGYKVLDTHVRVIQGDGVNRKSIPEILQLLKEHGWAAENMVFGCGGKLLQDFNRDTFNFAIKCCRVEIGDEVRYVEKSPTEINAAGELTTSFKKSKKGLLKLVKTGDSFLTVSELEDNYSSLEDELITVFENGELTVDQSFHDIRVKVVR
jgi:nicotinamide phosphoribosyltransferase